MWSWRIDFKMADFNQFQIFSTLRFKRHSYRTYVVDHVLCWLTAFLLLLIITCSESSQLPPPQPSHLTSSSGTDQAPSIRSDLPSYLLLSATSGGILRCHATGHPTPQVHWTRSLIPELCDLPADLDTARLTVQREGHLLFSASSPRTRFRCAFHCVASNKLGQVVSAPVVVVSSKLHAYLHEITWIRSDGILSSVFLNDHQRLNTVCIRLNSLTNLFFFFF